VLQAQGLQHLRQDLAAFAPVGKPLAVQVEYPNSRGKLDLFKIVDGKISHIDGVSVFLPYHINSLWQQ
jgi:hypothetical protein